MEYQFRDNLAPRYYDSYLRILLLHVLEQLAGVKGRRPELFTNGYREGT